jgi:NADH:ubiquinone oxidoreductase subunit 6 (subunit J)
MLAIADNPTLPVALLLAATALGMAAIYCLLPRPGSWLSARFVGSASAGLALAVAGVLAARSVRLSPETVLFYAFAGLALLAGGVMITRTNPARAALSFALVVLSTTGLFLLLAAPFLMAGTVIVYAGAIVVMFLFVIMLAQPGGASDADERSREPLLSAIAGFFLLATLVLVLHETYTADEIDSLLATVNSARQQESLGQIRATLGDQAAFVAALEKQANVVPAGTGAHQALRAETDGAGAVWSAPSSDLARKRLDGLAAALAEARGQVGRLQPPPEMRLSPMAGTPANQKSTDIPTENVAGLGRTLFSDYLLAVEIAGTLLLVATVGAIVIAQRPVATRRGT